MSDILHTYVPRVKYNNVQGKPYVVASAKGISNGLSDTLNDGADFGPDTMLGATAPGQYGPPYTQTSGIQEAYNYLGGMGGGIILLKSGTYYLKDILYLQYSDTKIVGEDMPSTVLHLAYPFNALGSGGYQNSNPIVTTDPSGSAQPEYTGLENLTIDASEAGKQAAGISVVFAFWGSHITFRNIRLVGLNGASTTPNGLNCGVDYLTIENLRASQNDYVTPGTIPAVLVIAGGNYVTVRDVYMDGYWEFDGSPTPNSIYENITVNGNNILFDGSGSGDWGYTPFKNIRVLNRNGRAINGGLQARNGLYCVDCYFEGAMNVSPLHTYNSKIIGGVIWIYDFRNNYVYQDRSLLYSLALGTPVVIGAYEENGYYVAHVIGNVFVNINANTIEWGTAFVFSGFNASNSSQNILEIRDNIFATSFDGLFGPGSQSTSLVLIIENNKGPFLTTMGNSNGEPPPITAVAGSIIRNNPILIPSYPFSGGSSISIPANPPASGTVYQNNTPFDIELYIPVYASTSGTAGTVTLYLSQSSSPGAIATVQVSGSTSSSSPQVVTLRVPAWWYYEIAASGATIGTATVIGPQ